MPSPTQLRFDGRVAVITGAGRGLGREYALLLASRGAAVVVNDLGGSASGAGASSSAADDVVKEIIKAGGKAVANYDSVEFGERIIEAAIQAFGRVDIVINNAGILRDVTLAKMTQNDWDLIRKVHVDGAYKVTKAAWPHMLKQNYGRVIFVSSASGIYGNYGQSNYASAKMALYGLGRSLAKEGEKKNILVNIVSPFATSRMTEALLPEEIKKLSGPEYVAPFVVNLCHDSCADNGSLFEVGSGFGCKLRIQRAQGTFIKIDRGELPPGLAAVKYAEGCDFSRANAYSNTIHDVNWIEKAEEAKRLPSNPKGPNLRFDDRVVIVTGSGAGLGRSYAHYLAKYGAKVLVNDFNKAAADGVVQEIKKAGGQAIANYNSVLESETIVKQAMDTWGRVDVLVNNAGIIRDKSFMKMTEQEWNQVLQIHLDATFRMTKAVWPIMMKQSFGRIINTSSAVGLYGNFGQANYSAAKAGIIGFSKAAAIEGLKKNIIVSVIAPNAGTQMTQGLYTPEMVAMFKPDYIAPFVAFLSHETFNQTGQVYEVGSGWFAKVRWERSLGLAVDSNKPITLEQIHDTWPVMTDFKRGSVFLNTNTESGDFMVKAVMKARSGTSASKSDSSDTLFEITPRDIQLYNLGIGCSEKELKYVYENAPDFAAFPTFGVIMSFGQVLDAGLDKYLHNFNFTRLLHGEQYLEIVNPIPTSGKVKSSFEVLDVAQKGKSGSTVVIQTMDQDLSGKVICINEATLFIRGATPKDGLSLRPEKRRELSKLSGTVPSRAPDATVKQKIPETQAALYRLSGDLNPLHLDPKFAAMGGFEKPILHGLCSYGVAARHVISTFADNDPKRLKCVKARFSKHVFPGEEVQTEMWKISETRILFQLRVLGRNDIAVSSAFVELNPPTSQARKEDTSSNSTGSKADEMIKKLSANLEKMSDGARAELVKKTSGVYQLNVGTSSYFLDLKNGKGSIGTGAPSKPADIVLTLAEKDFIALSTGKLSTQNAYMKGLVKVKGNMMLGMKMGGILKALGSNPASKL